MGDWDQHTFSEDENSSENITSNKWDGEDEDEKVLDSWEDMNEEKKDVEKLPDSSNMQPKSKKNLREKIKEKERKAQEELERKAKEKEESMTPEKHRAEMLRRQKLQEEADLRLAMETFGVTEGQCGIDTMIPTNADEFKDFHDALVVKINHFNKQPDFPAFAEELIKNICVTLNTSSLRKVKTTIESLYNEKLKMEKEKVKKNKGKGKAKLKVESGNEFGDLAAYDANDYDDFM